MEANMQGQLIDMDAQRCWIPSECRYKQRPIKLTAGPNLQGNQASVSTDALCRSWKDQRGPD